MEPAVNRNRKAGAAEKEVMAAASDNLANLMVMGGFL